MAVIAEISRENIPAIFVCVYRNMDILDRYKGIVNGDGPLTILEIGTNDGYHTQQLAEIARKTNRQLNYYAFEPDKRHHASVNPIAAKYGIQFFDLAIGATDGQANFFLSGGYQKSEGPYKGQFFSGSSSLRRPTEHNRNAWPDMTFTDQTVQCMRLDTFAKLHDIKKIDFIWADVQGCEIDLIEGGREALSITRYLYTEYCNGQLYEGEIGLPQIMEMLPDFELVEDYGGDALLENRRLK